MSKEESKEEEIRNLFKGMNEKLDTLCKGTECLPQISKEISNLHTKLDKLKGEPETIEKKHQVFSFMSYCPECGEKIRDQPPEFECSDCHVPVDPKKDKICWNCGSKKAKRRETEK